MTALTACIQPHPENSPGLAQGVSDNRLEIEIQQETRTKIIE